MSLEERIKEIPGGDGWWKDDSEEAYLETAQLLIDNGWSEDDAVKIVDRLYQAAAEEFGN